MDAHAARVALLAEDLAEVSPRLLSLAIDRHVAKSPYLPKASDLLEIIADLLESHANRARVNRTNRPYVEDLADTYNATMSDRARSLGLEWHVTPNGELRLDFSSKAIAQNTVRIEQRKEDERREFKRRQERPVV